MEEVIIIGAGPCGLSTAIELEKLGVHPLIIEKQCVAYSIYLYPTYMQFFSTPELLEIGGIPFTTPNEKPSRLEALHYYRNTALRSKLRVKPYHTVHRIQKKADGSFELSLSDQFGQASVAYARNVVVATGYFDHPNLLGIPGEELPKVTHYYREAHPYSGTRTTIIGGNNSAIDAAMDLLRAGAEVTVVYRGEAYSPNIKPWVLPVFEAMVNKGRITMLFNSRVVRIGQRTVTIAHDSNERELDNDFVLALTGFRPDRTMLLEAGALMNEASTAPVHNPETMETTVPGLFIAGVAASGSNANEVFIETGRLHGGMIARHITKTSL
ncbi:YpdA family putative bacillithiol disulfide reductase [Paenibacillus radicis (ex Xue et al. 2023)]|uniref:YpdA family putative bacillithiol disulfide reductase n=1 Tax=Paenibacillus radicis (ex Xue et al. 2023) TaxID=2972489 RepID=A0ABT1YEX0_9BACL|nr:YpdA family putative bacillithiol disulfide reductase [Paenibacillus radicis (ex Xue et al. 2023)]MCR8631750.1 YpdA family putative bacillithiol disulfide reductase [Paenibacillus radicis (ex Xue et al. 2023)]